MGLGLRAMPILMRLIAVLLFLIAASLVYFVIDAFANQDEQNVRVWVAVIYIVLAIGAAIASIAAWRRASHPPDAL